MKLNLNKCFHSKNLDNQWSIVVCVNTLCSLTPTFSIDQVLQDSQEENVRLKHEVDNLKGKLVESGIGGPYAYLPRSDSESSYSEHGSRLLSSQFNSSNFDYSNVNGPKTGNTPGLSSGLPSFCNGDLHVKVHFVYPTVSTQSTV